MIERLRDLVRLLPTFVAAYNLGQIVHTHTAISWLVRYIGGSGATGSCSARTISSTLFAAWRCCTQATDGESIVTGAVGGLKILWPNYYTPPHPNFLTSLIPLYGAGPTL